jgi:hypothetical protein
MTTGSASHGFADGSLDEEFVGHANAELAPKWPERRTGVAGGGRKSSWPRVHLRGSPRMLVRLHANGVLDEAFMAKTAQLSGGQASRSPRVVVQSDRAVLLFQFSVSGAPVVRLAPDGGHAPWTAGDGAGWDAPAVGVDGTVSPFPSDVVRSHSTTVREVSLGAWSRLSTSGHGDGGPFTYLGRQSDGRVLIVSFREPVVARPSPAAAQPLIFLCGNDMPPREPHLVRVDRAGKAQDLMADAPLCERTFDIWAAAFQPDGGTLLAGDLPLAAREGAGQGCQHFAIWRVDADGRLDRNSG